MFTSNQLAEHFPKEVAFLNENGNDFISWIKDSTGQFESKHESEYEIIVGGFIAWGNSQGLTLSIETASDDVGFDVWYLSSKEIDQIVETYKGINIKVRVQTHTDTGSQYDGHGHHMTKNPNWTPPKPLKAPRFHAYSHDITIVGECYSEKKDKAISEYKQIIDDMLVSARWKKEHRYSDNLFKVSEKKLLELNP